MTLRLQQRDRRAIVLLGLALAAYVTISWAVLPAWDTLAASESSATEKEVLLQKYRQIAGRKGRYDMLLADLAKQKTVVEDRVIRAATPSLAAVEFQTLIETAARKYDISLSQRNVTPPTGPAEPRELTMALSFDSTPQKLVAFLTELRALPRSVRVLSLNVNPQQVAQEAPKAAPFTKDIRVGMTLGAWTLSTTGGN
jgi:hypothetical protein